MYNIITVNNSVRFKIAKRLDCFLTKYIYICIYLCDVIVVPNTTGVLLLQHISVANYHIVHLKLTQYIKEVKSLSHV